MVIEGPRKAVPAAVALPPGLAAACFTIPALLCLVASLSANPALLDGGLLNPDSAMRLVRLHEIIDSGRPLHTVARDGSGLGAILHWSHAFDSLILLLAAPFALLMGWSRAVDIASMALGPLGLGALGLALGWSGFPWARGTVPLWLGALAVGLATPLLAYSYAGVVHHHILLVVCAVMTTGWALRLEAGMEAGIGLGAWAGAGLWLSPESVPYTVMAFGLAGLGLWRVPGAQNLNRGLALSGLTFFIVTGLTCLVDPPLGGVGAAEPDRLSLMYVVFAGCTAFCCALPALGWGRLPACAAVLASAASWLWAFPSVLHGTEGLMTANEARAFFGSIAEMQPVRTVQQALGFLTGGALAFVFLGVLAVADRSALLAYSALAGMVLLLLGWQHVRFTAYPAALGAGLLPFMMDTLSTAPWPRSIRSASRVALLMVSLGLPLAADLAGEGEPAVAQRSRAPDGGHEEAADACTTSQAVALLKAYPGEIVLAPVNETPELLRQTDVLTVGSLYHRNIAAFMRLRAAWLSIPGDQLSPALRDAHVTLVLACPLRAKLDHPGSNLLDRLAQGRPPAWLARIGGDTGYILYRVTPELKPRPP